MAAPTIVNTNNAAVNGSSAPADHGRKPSVTISAAGASGYIPNGGPVVPPSRPNSLQFGSINLAGSSPENLPQSAQPAASLPVAALANPRLTSPQNSPSPIPQPAASGGRPPSGLQAQGSSLSFGSLGREADGNLTRENTQRSMRPVSMPPPGPHAPGIQAGHARRDSSHSNHGEMNNNMNMNPGMGRGSYPSQGARGRGYNQHNQQYSHQQIPYGSGPNNYRGSNNNNSRNGHNMGMPYQNQNGPMGQYPGSPHRPVRSPAITHALPGNPQMPPVQMANPPMPAQPYGYPPNMPPQVNPSSPNLHFSSLPNQNQSQNQYQNQRYTSHQHQLSYQGGHNLPPIDLSPENPFFEQFLMQRNAQTQHYPMPPMPQYSQPYDIYPPQYGGMYNMYASGPPSSPRPTYQQHIPHPSNSTYMQPQYVPGQSQPISRSTSQISEPRPGSSIGQSQVTSVPHTHPLQVPHTGPSPTPTSTASAFKIPSRGKSAGIVIRNPESGAVVAFGGPQASNSTPQTVSKSPIDGPVSSSKHGLPSRVPDPAHSKVDTKSAKSKSENMKDAVAKKIEADKAEEKRIQQEEELKLKKEQEAAEKEKKDAEEKALREKVEAARAKQEAEAKAQKDEEERILQLEVEKAKKDAEDKLKAEEAEAKKKTEQDAARAKEIEQKTLAEKNLDKKADEGENSSPVAPATSGSEESMGPPQKSFGPGGRSKPAALNLAPLKTNTVEPPQPSAAFKSLTSARLINRLIDVKYPEGIMSPDPSLNISAPVGKFKYEREFLLQFQVVFTEKPSLDWDAKLKDTVGDTSSSANPPSARTPHPHTMPPRSQSNRPGTQQGYAHMGSFENPNGRTIDQRSTRPRDSRGQTLMANALPAFNRTGSFPVPGSHSMSRTNSSTTLQSQGNIPQSPRSNPSNRGRGGSKRGNQQQEKKEESKMPLTAGTEIKPLPTSGSGWKPRSIQNSAATGAAGPALGAGPAAGTHMEPDMVQRKVKSNLNKMTPEKFDKISDQILEISAQSKDETDGRTLRQVIQLTFEKATDEAHWASMYAKFCKRMLETMDPNIKDESIRDKLGNVVTGGNLFRKYLLNRCQEEFEKGWKLNLPPKPEGESEEAVMLSDAYYIEAAAKRRGLGLVQFIGELYKLGMLTERIMHECVKKLVDYDGIPEEAEVESLTKLLKTIGSNLDSTDKGKPRMDVYFARIQNMMDTPELPSRLKYMLMDILDLRRKGWQSKEDNKGPKTLDEVREEAQQVIAQKEAEKARQQQHNSRGGRMPGGGRGDARSYSGAGYGMMPPPQQNNSLVGMEDLRRLQSQRSGSNRQASQGQGLSLGPSSMFNSRSNSGRRGALGPGGFSRAGEESGTSSRTATPPARPQEPSTSVNAFSALAGLDASGEPENPASPPSAASSPPSVRSKLSSDDKGKGAASKADGEVGGS
ncbi:MAG: hypothetical protein M1829_005881 [Trizodia sp. TS-e1964]|nr:MAG: hypothetical protein M1829_005881 [Trizodia sp. TS-e1964]